MDGGGGGHGLLSWSKHLGQARAGNWRICMGDAGGAGTGGTDGVDALGGSATGRAVGYAVGRAMNDTTKCHNRGVTFAHR
jgi:hypothetical protein